MKRKSILKFLKITVIVIACIWLCFAILRMFNTSEHIIYIPFSGRVFNFDSSEVERITVIGDKEFQYHDTPEEIELATNRINDFRSYKWGPVSNGPDAPRPAIRVELKDGSDLYYIIQGAYIYTGNIVYTFPEEQIEQLLELSKLTQ